MTGFPAFTLGLSGIVLLFAVLQTLFLTMMLLAAPGNRSQANRILCAVLLMVALALGEFALIECGITERYPHLFGMSIPAWFLLAPLYQLYTRALLKQTLRLRDFRHLLPGAAGIALAGSFLALPASEKLNLLHQMTGTGFEAFPLLAIVLVSLNAFQSIAYFCRAYFALERFELKSKSESAGNSIAAASWLKQLTMGFCVFVVVSYLAAAELFLMYPWRESLLSPGALGFAMAAFVFWVAWQMFRNPDLFALCATADTTPRTRYAKTQLTAETLQRYEDKLLLHMHRQQSYLDGELRLSDLAESLEMQPHHLSQVINLSRGQSFFEFVNTYRVAHARAMLEDPTEQRNVLEVALASGFNSKASFNRAFAKATGMTPSACRKRASAARETAHPVR